AVIGGIRGTGEAAASLPQLERENRSLRARNVRLELDNARLHEQVAGYSQQVALAPKMAEYRNAIDARVIGFPPENEVNSVTIDKGTRSGVSRDDGVLAANGVVGRVVEAGPFTSKVALITDFASSIPAIAQRGRYWGIAKGNDSSVRLEYVSQDAPLKIGDRVVTGEARSFHSGAVIGTIVGLERGDAQLYQTAIVKPAVDLSRLDRVIVVPK
ncbi:MAG: rod shape-determining protein MreC, partial [Candidatus Eremiobacteraeota bacterium]|nr:rod shape-determining protein MreC [Candidatus Eremiobacteraeota bacterium]